MLTPTLLRDMHKRIVEAHVLGFTQVSNWTTVKDEPQSKTGPLCWFKVPIGVPSFDERRNVFRGLLCDVHFLVSLKDGRSIAARDDAYNAMSEAALRCFAKFQQDYTRTSPATFQGIELYLSIDDQITFEPYVEEGASNLTGCRLLYTVRDQSPLSCADDLTIFPSL